LILALDLVLAYLIGAFPSSVVLGRLFRGVDVRRVGSGNAGATNAWRVLGWRIGLAVMVLDVAKGAVAAAVIPRVVGCSSLPVSLAAASIFCGFAAVLGHVFPIYIGFRGGKGVATAAGMLVAVAPIPVAIAAGGFLLAVTTTGWVSLGSLVGAWCAPIAATLVPPSRDGLSYPLLVGLTAALAVFITVTHRANVKRLLRGEEKKFPRLQIWRALAKLRRRAK
jgi:acyl phosphate:glycerol-3-phosphate acyltransferase